MDDIVRIEDSSNIEKKIIIYITPTTVNKKFDDFFNNIKKEAQIAGFRKGKVPVKILKKHFKEKAKNVISQMLISEYYQNALKKYNINPIGRPVIKTSNKNNKILGKFNEDNSYNAELTVEIIPSVDPVGYDNIELNLPESNETELYEKKLLEYRNNFAEREQITDGQAKLNDTLVIDFKGFIDNEQFNGGSANGFTLDQLGSGTLIPGFEEQLVGMKPSETKKIEVVFPEQYNAAHLSNKKAEFEVTVHSIVRKTLANIDDDLAMMVGFETVDQLKKNIKEEVKKDIYKQQRQIEENIIIKKLLEENNFDVPKSLIQQEQDRIFKHNNISNPSKEILEQANKVAIDNIRKTIIFEEIYNKEQIEITPDELNKYLEEQAKIYNKDKDEIVSMLHNTNQMDSFVGVLKNQKVIDFIIDKNTKKGKVENE